MKKESISIAKEGYPIIGLFAVSALVFACFKCPFGAIIFLAFLWFSVFFFRDPERDLRSALLTEKSSVFKNAKIRLTAKKKPVFPYS